MTITPSPTEDADPGRNIDQCGADAAALVQRFGTEGVAWLDAFLADYLFSGEPLDRVLVKARELSGLAPRAASAFDLED